MRVVVTVLLVLTTLAGCSAPDDAVVPQPFPLDVYRFTYPGSDVAVEGVDHGWLLRVSNPTQTAYRTTVLPTGLEEALLGPVGRTDGSSPRDVYLPARIEGGITTAPAALELGPGESGVFLFKVASYSGEGQQRPVSLRVFAAEAARPDALQEAQLMRWNVTVTPAAQAVLPGDHVSTATVGVWINGTSFYTNIGPLIDDPAFPAGFDRNETSTDPLPIYVYGQDRSEQPEGSKDACRFTTIDGYNALLKTQAAGSTGVTLMRPEAAYTRPGNEDHFLYGDALIFLNTIVGHDGSTGPTHAAPDPTGPCFGQRLEDLPLPSWGAFSG